MGNATFDAHDHREQLRRIARQAMVDYGLWPEFSREAIGEAERARPVGEAAAPVRGEADRANEIHDLRNLLWCSIDNDD